MIDKQRVEAAVKELLSAVGEDSKRRYNQRYYWRDCIS